MNRFVACVCVCVLGFVSMSAQEFNCSVQVTSQGVQGTNKNVFETMQAAITEFINDKQWTDNVYSSEERIECNILINIKEVVAVDEFKGTMRIQARRPVYGTSYSSVLLNFMDNDFHVNYTEQEPLVLNVNNFSSNLVSMLAFYANVILGLDYDTFSMNGGTKYFQTAEKIVSAAQSASEKGWKSFESKKNKYWLIENILNEQHKPLRRFYYEYHRLGLDVMSSKPQEGRAQIAKGVESLSKVNRQKPGSFFLQVFLDAKSDEMVNIFTESPAMEKTKVVEILKEVDPVNGSDYDKIISSK